MLVVIADKLPPAVRGKMKLWFIEPKPNVFISNVSDNLAMRVAEKLIEYCDPEAGMLVAASIRGIPGYKILQKGNDVADIVELSNMQLIRKRQKGQK